MGRSSAEQAQQNRARIVEGASRLFRERGVEAVSVAEIMAAVEMTVGGFYKHFASKEALVEEAAGRAFEDAGALWDHRLRAGDQTSAALRAKLVAQYLWPRPGRQCPIIAFAPHAAGEAATLRETYGTGTGALLERFFNTPGNEADLAQADPRTLLVFAAMVGARVMGEAAGDAPWVEVLKQAVADEAERQAGWGATG
ncbi:TetR/AcrR family transcriptional regulator [Paracoccus zhejiangensis]|uniref:TetR family transcriptional regulator n=1 Tax=Paracoccus zhejiangensis TaxID=1077935 RepID=A0A2H5F544_9RHOB|nr:TetR/AcrR family transcriptional regulator [Paracoccus zhejiangensis]AUH66657.1 TetR family transcriptional regulator [Paracoccus zhejiangensis]